MGPKKVSMFIFDNLFNPFMQNVFSHSYQLEESISNFRVVWWYFSLLFKFQKKTVENLIRRHILWRLIWFCTVC